MSEKIWSDDAWKDYLYWQTQDKKTLKRINQLIQDIERNCFYKKINCGRSIETYIGAEGVKAGLVFFVYPCG